MRLATALCTLALGACAYGRYSVLCVSSDSDSMPGDASEASEEGAREEPAADTRSDICIRIEGLLADAAQVPTPQFNTMFYTPRQLARIDEADRNRRSTALVDNLIGAASQLRYVAPSLGMRERRAIATAVRGHAVIARDALARARETALWRVVGMVVVPIDSVGCTASAHETTGFDWFLWPQRIPASEIVALLGKQLLTYSEFAMLLRDRHVIAEMTYANLQNHVSNLVKEAPLVLVDILRGKGLGLDSGLRRSLATAVAYISAGPHEDTPTSSAPAHDRLFDTAVRVLAQMNIETPAHPHWLPGVWRAVIDGPNTEDSHHTTAATDGMVPGPSVIMRRLASLIRASPAQLVDNAASGALDHMYNAWVQTPGARSASHHTLQKCVALLVLFLSGGDAPPETVQGAMFRGLPPSIDTNPGTKAQAAAIAMRMLDKFSNERHGLTAGMVVSAADTILGAMRIIAKAFSAKETALPIFVPRVFFDVVLSAAHHTGRPSCTPTAVHLLARSMWRHAARMVFDRLSVVAAPRSQAGGPLPVIGGEDKAFAAWQDGTRAAFAVESSAFDALLRFIVIKPYAGPQTGGESASDEEDEEGRRTATGAMRRRKAQSNSKVSRPRLVPHTATRADRSEDEGMTHSISQSTVLTALLESMSFGNGSAADQTSTSHVDNIANATLAAFPLPPLFFQHHETLIEALSARMDRMVRIVTPRNSRFFSALRCSLRLRSVAERCRVLSNRRKHPTARGEWSGAGTAPLLPRARGRAMIPAFEAMCVVLLPARIAELGNPAHVTRALQMHALLHYGVDPKVFLAAMQSVFGGMQQESLANCGQLRSVAAVFASLLGYDVHVAILSHRS